MPLVADDTLLGGAWAAYRVAVPAGSQVHYDIEPTMKDARRNVASAWLLKANGSLAAYFLTTSFSGFTRERHVELPSGGVIMSERSGGMYGQGGLGGGWQFNTAGEYILLHVATSDGSISSRLRLYVTEGVELLAKTMDRRTFVYAESDFRGTANVTLSEPCILNISPLCLNTKVLVQQELTVPVAGRLFGDFQSVLDPVLVRSYEGPASSRSGIIGTGAIVLTNEPSGTYRFAVDVNVGAPLSGLAVWGADVELPEALVVADDGFGSAARSVGQGWILQLRNEGEALHNFTVEDEEIDVDIKLGTSVSVPISLDPTTYLFRCRYHPEMTGQLTVRQL